VNSNWALVILTFVLAVATFWYAYSTHKMLKEMRETRTAERSLLAGALASELRGFLELWNRAEQEARLPADYDPTAKEPKTLEGTIGWVFHQSYTSTFDGSGSSLHLLRRPLVDEVTNCYCMVKRTLDDLNLAQKLSEYAKLHPYLDERKNAHNPAGRASGSATARAIETGRCTVVVVRDLIPKLDAAAIKP